MAAPREIAADERVRGPNRRARRVGSAEPAGLAAAGQSKVARFAAETKVGDMVDLWDSGPNAALLAR